jgi:Uma2 family endonuclease
MSLAEVPATPRLLTPEDLLDMPDDGIERDLIAGVLMEWPTTVDEAELTEADMTRRNPEHSETQINFGHELRKWLDIQPRPRGKITGSEAGFRLRRDPNTFVGIDVAYVSAEMVANRNRKLRYYDGPPVLAIEILSPSDQHGKVVAKIESYLEVGSVVWIAEPYFRTVTVYRAGEAPVMFNDRQELDGEPYLPGFRVPVAQLFEG